MVWDSFGESSYWHGGDLFITRRCAPNPDFSWDPLSPILGEDTQFTDESSLCNSGEVTAWEWSFEGGDPATVSGSRATTPEEELDGVINPVVVFLEISPDPTQEDNLVELTVTGNGIECTDTQLVTPRLGRPDWIEVHPGD